MDSMWTLGGLSLRELLARTASEAWEDAVFGQAGRMAFYHFLAIFPSLLIFLTLTGRIPSLSPGLKDVIASVVQQFLPVQVLTLEQQMMAELGSHVPGGLHLLLTCAGTLWAALNGTWALVYGLNKAYEVEECRGWWKLAIVIAGLTFSLAFAGLAALILLFSAEHLSAKVFHEPRPALLTLEWLAVVCLLMLSFAIVYRFAPNLRDHEWKWSTPGAICALLLWVGATAGLRFYFQHVNDYSRAYGHLNSVVMLMLWLYFTNGAILIGGEMNSEIEKAAGGQAANRSGK